MIKINTSEDCNHPSKHDSKYWIYADYPKYIFQKPLPEREAGKWLIFESIEKIDVLWEKIKIATEKGNLGPYSKVSTIKEKDQKFDKSKFVICVYTENFHFKEDIERIEEEIRKIGIKNDLFYKLNRDAGKYEHDGYQDLIKIISREAR